MVQAFLRNVFWIVPLFLVLVPDASSPSMDSIRLEYDNMLSIDITNLQHDLQNTSDFRGPSCNSTKENTTGQNAAVCRCCCNSNMKKALCCMARCLKKISETWITSSSQLQHSMSLVSGRTLKLLRQEPTSQMKLWMCHQIQLHKPYAISQQPYSMVEDRVNNKTTRPNASNLATIQQNIQEIAIGMPSTFEVKNITKVLQCEF